MAVQARIPGWEIRPGVRASCLSNVGIREGRWSRSHPRFPHCKCAASVVSAIKRNQ